MKQSNLSILLLIKRLSAENGPIILTSFFCKFSITGCINFFSSVPISPFSPACGFKPEIISFGFLILKSNCKDLFKL